MTQKPYHINPDITKAETLPGTFYTDPATYEAVKEEILTRSWQVVGFKSALSEGPVLYPFRYMPGSVDEPLILAIDAEGRLRILSNVCTHRGNLLIDRPTAVREIRCGYHGRRFDLDGKFKFMPETKGMEDFPCERDDLPALGVVSWKGFYFTSLEDDRIPFQDWIGEVEKRVGWMPIEQFKYDPERSKSYVVEANWALYCDNYLEGFHIPFVHPELSHGLDFGAYQTETFDWGVLQLGIAKEGEVVFDLPEDSPEYGQRVAAYYFWLFPNIMFNFYPWGLSLNIVYPMSIKRTKVEFHSYIWKEDLLGQGAGGDLDMVEYQDEDIVERVQKVIGSRLYKRGRFSPRMEQGVHKFHQLISTFLNHRSNESI